jgi:hypothetical protein
MWDHGCTCFSAEPEVERLSFDPLTRTVTLDGKAEAIQDPKAFTVYQVIADKKGELISGPNIRALVPGTNGHNAIRKLLNSLPRGLRPTVESFQGRGYALRLPKKKGAK